MDKNYKKHNKMTKTLKWKQKTETNKIVLNILIKTIISVIKTKQKNTGPLLLLKGSSDAHFPQVDMILYGLNEKSITYFG